MRAVLFIMIIAVLVAIAALATGFVRLRALSPADPQLSAGAHGISAKPGRAPAFDVESGSVKIGSTQAIVPVPSFEVKKPPPKTAATANNNM